MTYYNKYVPHTHTPNIDLFEQVLKAIKSYNSLEHVPQLWQDLLLFGYSNRMELIEQVIESMDIVPEGDPLLPTLADQGEYKIVFDSESHSLFKR